MKLYTDEMETSLNQWSGILPSPSRQALKNSDGIRIFENSILENVISKAHWIVPGLWVFPVVGYLFVKSLDHLTAGNSAALVLIGLLSWTLLEYGIHKFLFHFRVTAETSPALRRMLFNLHGYHHEYPSDPSRLVMPIALSWPLGFVIGAVLRLILGAVYFYPFFGGILLGYLMYDWTHYYSHHGRPKNSVGRYLHKFHAIHHFVDQDHNFGISTPIWDWILQSAREPKL